MIDSLTIRNFRLFRELELERLSRVNLFAGRNNSGKSSLLEAVAIHASRADGEVLREILASRQELQPGRRSVLSYNHFFHGHETPDWTEEGIVLSSGTSSATSIRTAVFVREERDGVAVGYRQLDPEQDPADFEDHLLFFVVQDGSGTRRLLNPEESQEKVLASPGKRELGVVRVAAQDADLDELASWWDRTSLTDSEGDVLAGLNVIEPGITGLAFVEQGPQKRRIPMIRHGSAKQPLPLKSLGDGIYRLLHVILALANAREGVVLIDEVENGLHWSIQFQVWELVFNLAEKLDVQVFATTHSRDCIRGFTEAWKEDPGAGTFYRFDRDGDKVTAVLYDHETLTDALETDVEMR